MWYSLPFFLTLFLTWPNSLLGELPPAEALKDTPAATNLQEEKPVAPSQAEPLAQNTKEKSKSSLDSEELSKQPDILLMIPDEEISLSIQPQLTRGGKKKLIENSLEVKTVIDKIDTNVKSCQTNIKTIENEIATLTRLKTKNQQIQKKLAAFLAQAQKSLDENQAQLSELQKDRQISSQGAVLDPQVDVLLSQDIAKREDFENLAKSKIKQVENSLSVSKANVKEIDLRMTQLKQARRDWKKRLAHYQSKATEVGKIQSKYQRILEGSD